MAEEWFVRVEGREYGPVDLATLLEWKAEGRLIATNELRKSDDVAWSDASAIPQLFPPPLPGLDQRDDEVVRRRTFGQIISETIRIYAKGFPQFFALALFIAIPSLGLKLSLAFINIPEGEPLAGTSKIAAAVAVVMLAALLAAWPIFLGALQFATADLAAGQKIRLGDILRRATNFWPRIAKLAMFVYGSFMFWTVLPVILILGLAATPSIPSLLLAFVALAFQVYMAGRLFINFLFWQQSCTLGGLEGIEALRDSRDLARSRRDALRMQRPLYRGAILASLWVLVVIALGLAVEVPFMMWRLRGITDLEQAVAMIQTLARAPGPDMITIITYVLSSVVNAIFRPLLGIAFVILYFDARAGFRGDRS